MQVLTSILWVEAANVGAGLVADLRAIHPEGYDEEADSFSCERRPEGDPVLARVRERLDRAGLTPARIGESEDEGRTYNQVRFRTYDAADLAAAPLLVFTPTTEVASGHRDEAGQIKLGVRKLSPTLPVALAHNEGWYVVPERIKARLEAADLIGVTFRATIPSKNDGQGGPATWPKGGEPWWELRGAGDMPPFAPGLDLTDGHGRPLADRADDSQGLIPVEEFFDLPELRYRAADLAAMPPFDLARSRERVGTAAWNDNRFLIASPRFVAFCREHDFPVAWAPVRVDAA